MKSAFAALSAVALGWSPAEAARLQETPASRVVTLIKGLEASIEADGKKEQESYDKYACWCEDTLQRKARNINEAKETIADLETTMKELKGEIASHGAEIEQLEKDIKQNLEAQSEAKEVRNNEYGEYNTEKTESEQCIGALEAAIKVLTGAGAGKKGFLETMKEAQLLSIVARVRGVLNTPAAAKKVSDRDLGLVKRFVDRPEDFVGQVGVMSAIQISNNPFGDYAPQSTQIQGILRGMYDAFAGDLEKSDVEEANQQKAHEELMATKEMELKTLEMTLEKQNLEKASKTDELAKSKRLRDDTRVQLDADEEFFADTKSACQVKATEWSERTRLRTEELQGIATAITILSSPEAKKTFETSGSTLLQLAQRGTGSKERLQAYASLKRLAGKLNSMDLASLAVQVKTSGHFDEVIVSIDEMIAVLRKEEQMDIAHRDRCQNSEQKNVADTEDIGKAIGKSEKEIKNMEAQAKDLEKQIKDLETEIADIEKDMAKALKMRNAELSDHKAALEEDTNAIALLDQAMAALARFYKANKIPILAQGAKQAPEYTQDEDKAPETIWSGSDYGGRKSESQGIIAILKMLKEDVIREMDVARSEDAEAQAAFEKSRGASRKMVAAATDSKVAREQDLAELMGDKTSEELSLSQSKDDDAAQEALKNALYKDCSWVTTHFKTRRDKRKVEIDGLVEAKGYLAGAMQGSGDDLIPEEVEMVGGAF